MSEQIWWGIMLPFFGTCMGAAFVFFIRKNFSDSLNSVLCGFAAGIMTAAAVWSLLLPAIERSEDLGRLAFLPSVAGFWSGIVLLMLTDKILTCMTEGQENKKDNKLSFIAVTLHNIPEGMAVGMVWAAFMADSETVSSSVALALSMGVAIQNVPEGAIVSMPFYAQGKNKLISFLLGGLSGVVEPLGSVITIAATAYISAFLPCLLAAAAGAMIYVTVDKLIFEMRGESESKKGMIFYCVGFTLMMALDVSLG